MSNPSPISMNASTEFGISPREIIAAVAAAADELQLAAPASSSCQQSGDARQLDHDARHDALPRRASRPSGPHPVSQLRRRSVGPEHILLAGRAAGRIFQRAREPVARRRPGALRSDDDNDGRQRRRPLSQPATRQPLVQPRHRMRIGLRHRADRVQAEEPRACLAMGDRPGMVSLGPRPVADRALAPIIPTAARFSPIRRSFAC